MGEEAVSNDLAEATIMFYDRYEHEVEIRSFQKRV